MCEWAQRGLQRGAMTTTALALAESCLRRSVVCLGISYLVDDLDHNGTLESFMRDDGLPDDETTMATVSSPECDAVNIRLVRRWNSIAEGSLNCQPGDD